MSTLPDNPASLDNSPEAIPKSQLRKYFPENFGTYLPNIFPLGYFVRRCEPRLLYVMPLIMEYEGSSYQVKSKNISSNGVQLFMPRTFILEGKTVQLTFDKFKKNLNSVLGGTDEFTNFEKIDYLIKEVLHLGEKTYISLVQQNLTTQTRNFFHRFIMANRLRYKIDATDRIYASKAQYYENLYTVNMQHVPMFICWNKMQGFYVDTVIKTKRNSRFFDYLSKAGSEPDLSAFCIPRRIEKFAELARQSQSALLFTYWEDGRFHSLFDFEFQSNSDMAHIVIKVSTRKGRIFKTSTNLNKKPVAGKITAMLSKIQAIDAIASKTIDQRASQAIAQILLTDITHVFSRQKFFSQPLRFKSGQALSLNVQSGNEQRRLADGFVIKSYADTSLHMPEIIHFSIGHNRYDARYHYEMDISVKFNNHVYSARTIDFSRSGLGLVINQPVEIVQGSKLEISFSSLLLKGVSTQLEDIPHRVMIARRTKDGLFLGVIRNTSDCDYNVNRFFSNLVKRNKDKLELCVKDKIDSVSTTFFEAFVSENIQTIPIVITRDRNNQHYIREIGLTDTPCNLAEKLYIKGHGYDFRFLTTELRLNELHQRALKATEKNPQSFMLFIFKALDEQGQESIFSVTDFELIRDEQIDRIIITTLQHNGACVRIQFMNNLLIDKLYRNMTLDKVDKINKAAAKLLSQEYKEIIGFAEMLDLTDEYRKQYESQ
ncbi:MAG: PilZ domain-containing protein [Gammaproteobacteria bacterium]|nr:PilZ domain-containing protein [Gammaproteobacteria bacterium]